jgi:hypothetical protein
MFFFLQLVCGTLFLAAFFQMWLERTLRTLSLVGVTYISGAKSGPPKGFPASGNGIWLDEPGSYCNWASDYLPIGNGYLAGKHNNATAVCFHDILSPQLPPLVVQLMRPPS